MTDNETRYWKQVALYLADCHAATAEYDGELASVSKARKARYVSICHSAAEMIRGRNTQRPRIDDDVLRRLDGIVRRATVPGGGQDSQIEPQAK